MGWAIALHGGAGDIPFSLPPDRRELRLATLRRCLHLGVSALQDNKSALDVVELVVRELENDPQYNAGVGSVLTTDGTVEMEACIMDGNTMRCGAVSGLTRVINPISLARRIMDTTPHIYLAFHAAESFAQSQALPIAHPRHFITQDNIQRLHQAKASNTIKIDHDETGTVGCVAVDIYGNLATATSTGGLVNKMAGRIGDTPIIGAGTYANHLCAVSATGKGEEIIRSTAARDVAALMEFKGLSLTAATAEVISHRTPRGTCGIIAVSPKGDITLQFNTTGMYRAAATEAGYHEVAIWS